MKIISIWAILFAIFGHFDAISTRIGVRPLAWFQGCKKEIVRGTSEEKYTEPL